MAAQRGNHGTSIESFQVQIDGLTVATIQPTGTTYATYTTPTFTVTAGTHTIAFIGTGPTTSDSTAFLDAISIAATPPPTPFTLGDAGFEDVAVGSGFGAYTYRPTGSAWTYSGLAGLAGNNSAFTASSPNAPQGQQVAFVQNQGTITQVVNNWTAGNYVISFQAAQRGNYGSSNQVLQILIDGVIVATIRPTSTTYNTFATPAFAVTAGTHTITIAGTAPANGDSTAFLDAISVTRI